MAEARGRPQETAQQFRYRRLRAEWRGVYEPPDLTRFEKTVADVVAQVLKRAGLNDRLAEETMIREWGAMVGDFLAGQSKPTGLRNGVLQVMVLQAAVRYDLERNLKREILQRLQQRFGKAVVKDLRFVSG
jgi:predicted nucleic acid-binding Zn ribbon protein